MSITVLPGNAKPSVLLSMSVPLWYQSTLTSVLSFSIFTSKTSLTSFAAKWGDGVIQVMVGTSEMLLHDVSIKASRNYHKTYDRNHSKRSIKFCFVKHDCCEQTKSAINLLLYCRFNKAVHHKQPFFGEKLYSKF